MSSENQEDLLTPDVGDSLLSDSITVEKGDSNNKSSLSQSSLEIEDGAAGGSSVQIKNDTVHTALTNIVDGVILRIEEGSDEELQLKWEDEDEDIEEDIISLHVPEETIQAEASYDAVGSNIQTDIEKTPNQAIDDNIDKEIIDITDLSSPTPDEMETQSNVNIPHVKEKQNEIDEELTKNEENTITIYDADDSDKVDENVAANVIDDDDLIIIEDDNDDGDPTTAKPKEKCILTENTQSKNKLDVTDVNVVPKTPNDSLMETSTTESNLEHKLNKPDMMLEIPTQEVIDCLDDSDVSNTNISIELNSQSSAHHTKETRKPVESVIDAEVEAISSPGNNIVNKSDQIDQSMDENNILQANLDVSKPLTEEFAVQKTTSDSYANENKMQVAESKESTSEVTGTDNKEVIDNITADVEICDIEHVEKRKNVVENKEDASIDIDLLVTDEEDLKKTADSSDVSLKLNETVNKTDNESQSINSKDESEVDNAKSLPHDTLKLSEHDVQLTTSNACETVPDSVDKELTESIKEVEAESAAKDISVSEMSIDEEMDEIVTPDDDGTANAVSKETVTVKPTLSQGELASEQPKDVTEDKVASETLFEKPKVKDAPVPSTSTAIDQAADSNDGAPEVSDSLGLLAESSRVVEDDEEPEDEEDDEDDFDQDESSNQMTAEHSEDSNAQHSETDGAKDQENKGVETPQEEKDEFDFATGDAAGDAAAEKGDALAEATETVEAIMVEQIDESATSEPPDVTGENKDDEKDPSQPSNQLMEVETVKLSDNSDTEIDGNNHSILKSLLTKHTEKSTSKPSEEAKTSPSKKLEITKATNVLNFVDLEESSSEEDTQEADNKTDTDVVEGGDLLVSADVEVESSPVASTETTPPKINRTTRINTSEVTIKTATSTEPTIVIPEAKPPEEKSKPKFSLEIFNLDSDEEDSTPALDQNVEASMPSAEIEKAHETNKCVNVACTSDSTVAFHPADPATVAFYGATKRKKAMVCENCSVVVAKRAVELVNCIKNFAPLLDLGNDKEPSELVEISDSESDEDTESGEEHTEPIGEKGAAMLEQHLRDAINETWQKFKLDSRLSEAELALNKELQKLEDESKEIDSLLNECQIATDKLRNDLYDTFKCERRELSSLVIFDTPLNKYSCLESQETFLSKRSMPSESEPPAKKPAIPLGYAPLDHDTKDTTPAQQEKPTPAPPEVSKVEDDKDIAVLKVSAESAPSDLPPLGEPTLPPLRAGMVVFAMRNTYRSWVRSTILECQGKSTIPGSVHSFTMCRVKVDSNKARGPVKLLPARWLAYHEPSNARMTIGTRVIALFKDGMDSDQKKTFFSGVIAEVPNPVNNYRYLVFFDDGYAQYVRHADTRIVCESSPLVWEEVHPLSREFVREYLVAYPERPMVRLHAGQSLKTEWNGKWWPSRVVQVDASLVKVFFEEDNRSEWIYRGSTRLAPLYLELQAAERHRARPMPRTKQPRVNMPYVEYLRSDEQNKSEEPAPPPQQQSEQRESRQRAVAKKSTATPQPQLPQPTTDNVISRVVYYTPKNAVKPYKMTTHTCGPHCKRSDVLALKDLRTYNPLAKPLLSGWERQIVRFKGHKDVIYRAPCGRRLRNMRELHRYLRNIQSDMAVDLFDFAPGTHCLAEFVLNTCRVGKKDLSHGKENVPVPCVNYYDDSLPEFCSYNTERTPTAGVPLNLDPEFLCGCDCTDDCMDKKKCACWQMTLEGARTIGLQGPNVGYVYKRLPEPLPSGIYECNSRESSQRQRLGLVTTGGGLRRPPTVHQALPFTTPASPSAYLAMCKCKQTCLNRVAQHPLQLKLQVFKTLNRGWGIRALNDVPKGSFLCVYAGNLLTDATANMDGLNEGDEYLAELDYIEVVEQMKEGYEEDIPEADKKLDKKNQVQPDDTESQEEESSSEDESRTSRLEKEDDDFQPPHIGLGVSEFSKRLRKREKKKEKEDTKDTEKEKEKEEKEQKQQKGEEDCITISDDEEVREPSRFTAQAGMQANEFISKYRSVRSHFGKDEACYIMDAKVQGNIGRYLNHSCCPNVFVQNVFVDTHDPRFPWVAFFALCHIKAGTELTWNYNYDVGSVPGKVLYCYCGAPNCRGRLL